MESIDAALPAGVETGWAQLTFGKHVLISDGITSIIACLPVARVFLHGACHTTALAAPGPVRLSLAGFEWLASRSSTEFWANRVFLKICLSSRSVCIVKLSADGFLRLHAGIVPFVPPDASFIAVALVCGHDFASLIHEMSSGRQLIHAEEFMPS